MMLAHSSATSLMDGHKAPMKVGFLDPLCLAPFTSNKTPHQVTSCRSAAKRRNLANGRQPCRRQFAQVALDLTHPVFYSRFFTGRGEVSWNFSKRESGGTGRRNRLRNEPVSPLRHKTSYISLNILA